MDAGGNFTLTTSDPHLLENLGMAGLRIGYMVAKPERIKMIQQLVRTEMGISVTSLDGAMASLEDVDFQNFTREWNRSLPLQTLFFFPSKCP